MAEEIKDTKVEETPVKKTRQRKSTKTAAVVDIIKEEKHPVEEAVSTNIEVNEQAAQVLPTVETETVKDVATEDVVVPEVKVEKKAAAKAEKKAEKTFGESKLVQNQTIYLIPNTSASFIKYSGVIQTIEKSGDFVKVEYSSRGDCRKNVGYIKY